MSEIDNEQRIAELEAQLLLLKDALASQQAEAEAKRKFDFGKVKDASTTAQRVLWSLSAPLSTSMKSRDELRWKKSPQKFRTIRSFQ